MKIAIVTSSEFSYASLLLKKKLPDNSDVILILNDPRHRSGRVTMKKVFKVGVLGVLFGYFSRAWYKNSFESVIKLATERHVCIYKASNFTVDMEAETIFKGYDLGISMGNGYIPQRFFSLFKQGMINIHHEILPDYPGAQSVVWPLIHNSDITGFSIHFITKNIDKGDLIVVEKRPIVFMNRLGETVKHNYRESISRSILKLSELLDSSIHSWPRVPNDSHVTYTTPTLAKWLRAFLNHSRKKKRIIRD